MRVGNKVWSGQGDQASIPPEGFPRTVTAGDQTIHWDRKDQGQVSQHGNSTGHQGSLLLRKLGGDCDGSVIASAMKEYVAQEAWVLNSGVGNNQGVPHLSTHLVVLGGLTL